MPDQVYQQIHSGRQESEPWTNKLLNYRYTNPLCFTFHYVVHDILYTSISLVVRWCGRSVSYNHSALPMDFDVVVMIILTDRQTCPLKRILFHNWLKNHKYSSYDQSGTIPPTQYMKSQTCIPKSYCVYCAFWETSPRAYSAASIPCLYELTV